APVSLSLNPAPTRAVLPLNATASPKWSSGCPSPAPNAACGCQLGAVGAWTSTRPSARGVTALASSRASPWRRPRAALAAERGGSCAEARQTVNEAADCVGSANTTTSRRHTPTSRILVTVLLLLRRDAPSHRRSARYPLQEMPAVHTDNNRR